jgi:amino acid transporter
LIKLVVIFLFMGFSLQFIDTSNWHPFIPESQGPGRFGWDGVLRGASIVFFAYIGFDAVSTAAQETKNPQRDMPIGILGSLFICTLIYIAMSAVMTGIMPYTLLGTPKPVATALELYPSLGWLKTLVEVGAIAGLSSVILVMMVGQPRIFYAMSRERPDSAHVRPHPPDLSHAARRHGGRGRHCRDPGRAAANRHAGRAGVDGYAARIRNRLHRHPGSAQNPA